MTLPSILPSMQHPTSGLAAESPLQREASLGSSLVQLKVPESWSPQVHSGVLLGMVTEVCWQGLLKNVPNRLCATALAFLTVYASHACTPEGAAV